MRPFERDKECAFLLPVVSKKNAAQADPACILGGREKIHISELREIPQMSRVSRLNLNCSTSLRFLVFLITDDGSKNPFAFFAVRTKGGCALTQEQIGDDQSAGAMVALDKQLRFVRGSDCKCPPPETRRLLLRLSAYHSMTSRMPPSRFLVKPRFGSLQQSMMSLQSCRRPRRRERRRLAAANGSNNPSRICQRDPDHQPSTSA